MFVGHWNLTTDVLHNLKKRRKNTVFALFSKYHVYLERNRHMTLWSHHVTVHTVWILHFPLDQSRQFFILHGQSWRTAVTSAKPSARQTARGSREGPRWQIIVWLYIYGLLHDTVMYELSTQRRDREWLSRLLKNCRVGGTLLNPHCVDCIWVH